jgi:hypothetical protein
LKVSLNSQIIYSGNSGLFTAVFEMGPLQRTAMSLIRFRFGRMVPPRQHWVCIAARYAQRVAKISLANFSFRATLEARVEFVPLLKESQNGLESPKNRRSAGRHGNQHVCLCRPQVSDRRHAQINKSDAGCRALRTRLGIA